MQSKTPETIPLYSIQCSDYRPEEFPMKTRSVLSTAGGAVVIGLLIWYVGQEPGDRLALDKVRKITSVDQTYGGEHVDRLAELGVEWVPAIASEMLSVEKFHSTYIMALSRIGSTDAVDPLLVLLSKLDAETSGEHRPVIIMIIDALEEISDRRATDILTSVMTAGEAHPAVRLAAARAVARIGDQSEQEPARAYILDRYGKRHSYYNQHGGGFEEIDMNDALMSVDTDESLGFLVETLTIETPAYVAIPIIRYLSAKNRQDITELLVGITDQADSFEIHVRLVAIESLAKHSAAVDSTDINHRLDDLEAEVIDGQWPSSFIDRIHAVRADL